MNPNCDGSRCRSTTGEVRVYPLGAGGNLILCIDCWRHENAYRVSRGDREKWPTEDWASAKRYPEDEPIPGWIEITRERYDEMLGAVPPLEQTADGFLLGEAVTHKRCTVTAEWALAFRAYMIRHARFYESDKPMTVREYREAKFPPFVSTDNS